MQKRLIFLTNPLNLLSISLMSLCCLNIYQIDQFSTAFALATNLFISYYFYLIYTQKGKRCECRVVETCLRRAPQR